MFHAVRKTRARIRARKINWNGHSKVRGRRLKKAIRIGQKYGLVVTSTTGGVHSPTSWHYKGRAVDIASGSAAQMSKAQGEICRQIGHRHLLELFGPAAAPTVKNGQFIGGPFPDHGDHLHVAA